MDLTNKSQLINYLQSHRLYSKKGLGQNFLVDRSALEKIVGAAELSKEDTVIEVGPGLGVLTEKLVKSGASVITVELDQTLAELLSKRLYQVSGIKYYGSETHDTKYMIHDTKLTIINSDILKVNLNNLVGDKPYKVVANIPYYITSKILRFFLEQENKPKEIVLLTQKEVAERICAKPGEMSVLSVSVQVYGEPEIVDTVRAGSFFPAPKVDSAILRIAGIKYQVSSIKEKDFFRAVNIGFSSRRKTLLNNLSAGYHLDKNKVLDILKEVGLAENTRAQELSIEQWDQLASRLIGK